MFLKILNKATDKKRKKLKKIKEDNKNRNLKNVKLKEYRFTRFSNIYGGGTFNFTTFEWIPFSIRIL